LVGRTISHYEITARIGQGGMGVVYKALDARLNRAVAIKVISLAHEADGDRRRRFVLEAKAASALNHPNIVTVYDVDRADGMDFIVMEYVPGRTLEQRLGTRGLPLGDVLRCLAQVADALSAAHAAGIVHRDLKPANIIIGESGVVKLLDFGVAKLTEPAAVAAAPTATAAVVPTLPGMVIGTPAYMSPEQARGAPVDQRTDVWAFGCVLYECLTGRRAFGGHSSADTLAKVLETEPDMTALPSSTPPALRQLIGGCLRKDPKDRLRFIVPVLLELAGQPTSASAAPTSAWKIVSGCLAVALVAVVGAWMATRRMAAPVAETPVAHLSMPFESSPQPRQWNWPMLAVSPDGNSLVYASAGADGTRRLSLRRINHDDAVVLAGTEGAASPFFSADARWVAFFAGGKLKKVSVPEGAVQTVSDLRSPSVVVAFGGAWGPGNTILFPAVAFQGKGMMRVTASGGTPEPVTTLGPGELSHRWPTLSPDGTVVVYTTSNSTGAGLEEPRIVAQSLVSGARETLAVDATYAKFAPDGRHLLLVRGGALTAVGFDPATLKVIGAPVPLMEGVAQASSGAAQFDMSRSLLAYLPGTAETRRLVWVDRQGNATPLGAPPRLYAHPRLSPDGNTVAVTITEPKNDIWLYDIPRGTLSRLTTAGRSNAYPIWTPDGKRITYVSSQDGRPPNVFWKSADGTGAEERLVTSANIQVTESWLRNGKTLLFVELRPAPTGWDILTLPLESSRQPVGFLESPYCDCTPQVSPSGRYLAHTSDESGRQEIQIRSFPNPGFKVTVSATGGNAPGWRGDERELYYVSGDAMMVAAVTPGPPLAAGKPAVLFRGDFASIQGKNYDVTKDGQRFLMIKTDETARPREIRVVLSWMKEAESLRQ
jgi:eukaryotic-like serine/threonine-protein kinase